MFRKHQLIASCFVAAAFSAPAGAGEVVSDLHPFTHIASIPLGADLSTIKFESVKRVQVATKLRSVTSTGCSEEGYMEPGGSMYCPSATDESRVPAYEVRYSYKGQPMGSDEYGSTHFTFSVYFRADELSPALRQAMSSGFSRAAAAELLHLTTYRDSVRRPVIDQAKSRLCDGNYVDGNWAHTDPQCEDSVTYKVEEGPSTYVTVNVGPVSARFETATAK